MKNRILTALSLFLAGALVGVVALPTPEAEANTAWTCYRVNELPDLGKAQSWKAAMRVATGLNEAAGHTPSGTVVTTKWDKGDADILCVKG